MLVGILLTKLLLTFGLTGKNASWTAYIPHLLVMACSFVASNSCTTGLM